MSEDSRAKVLIVDDQPNNLKILRDAIESEGYRIAVATNGQAALRIATSDLPDIILMDVVMPGMDGYEVCSRLKESDATKHIPVIFVTIRDEKEGLVKGFQAGGVDYITKPFEKEEVILRVETHLEINRLTNILSQKNRELEQRTSELTLSNQQLRQEIAKREQAEKAKEQAEDERQKADERFSLISQQEEERWGIAGFVGKSKTIRDILEDIRKLQDAEKTSVLITGESGTGKELIARAIHSGGTRAKGPFIPVNCSAIPSELAESFFFGHIRGAFSGARDSRKGYFELADCGTLFLDEIGDMPLELQPKLLRVIDDGCVVPVGGVREKHVDVRILAATNQDIQYKKSEGAFRKDLFFRIAGYIVKVPPLRERKEDIPLLVEHFLKMFAAEMGCQEPTLSKESLSLLKSYHFPGNVRELKNIIEHALLKSGGLIVKPQHLHFIDANDVPNVNTATLTPDSHPRSVVAHSTNLKQLEKLVVERSQPKRLENDESGEQPAASTMTDEEKILSYLREHGSITNPECRDLLVVDLHRASYLLKKMQRYGLLVREGEHRWSRYRLP